MWAPADFCLHRGESFVNPDENLRYFREPENAYNYIALYLCFEPPALKFNSQRANQLTQFRQIPDDLSDEESDEDKSDRIHDFRVFCTNRNTRNSDFAVIQYWTGSMGVVLLDELGKPVSNVHMKRKNESAVRQGMPGVPDKCECLGLRKHKKPKDGSVEIEVAWADGIVSWEDLKNIHRDAPFACLVYSTRKQLTRKLVWRELGKLRKGERLFASAHPLPHQEVDLLITRSNRRYQSKKMEKEQNDQTDNNEKITCAEDKKMSRDDNTQDEEDPTNSRKKARIARWIE